MCSYRSLSRASSRMDSIEESPVREPGTNSGGVVSPQTSQGTAGFVLRLADNERERSKQTEKFVGHHSKLLYSCNNNVLLYVFMRCIVVNSSKMNQNAKLHRILDCYVVGFNNSILLFLVVRGKRD